MLCTFTSGYAIGSLVEELSKDFQQLLPKLLNIRDEAKRYLFFIAWLNTELEKRGLGRIVLTGGFVVEVLTGRTYRTMDVDIIVEGLNASNVVEEFLKTFSERLGRGYLPKYEALQLKSIDIVSTTYDKLKKPIKLKIEEYVVYVEPVEELITTYLTGWKYWSSTEDRDKALWLYTTWREKLDINYLRGRCKEDNVEDYLEKLEEIWKQIEQH